MTMPNPFEFAASDAAAEQAAASIRPHDAAADPFPRGFHLEAFMAAVELPDFAVGHAK